VSAGLARENVCVHAKVVSQFFLGAAEAAFQYLEALQAAAFSSTGAVMQDLVRPLLKIA
jgi:hypothetical protein